MRVASGEHQHPQVFGLQGVGFDLATSRYRELFLGDTTIADLSGTEQRSKKLCLWFHVAFSQRWVVSGESFQLWIHTPQFFFPVTLTVISFNDSIRFHTTIFCHWSDCARTPNDPGFNLRIICYLAHEDCIFDEQSSPLIGNSFFV